MEGGGGARKGQTGSRSHQYSTQRVGSASDLLASYIGVIYRSIEQRNNAPMYSTIDDRRVDI